MASRRIIFWAAAVLFAALCILFAIPNFVNKGHDRGLHACINNLRQLDGAIQTWALEEKKQPWDRPTWASLEPYLRSKLKCPKGGQYTLGKVSEKPTCSIPGHALPADMPPAAPSPEPAPNSEPAHFHRSNPQFARPVPLHRFNP